MAPASRRPRLLMVTHRVPHPPNRGDRIRTWNTLRTLGAHFDIHLACLSDEPVHMQTWRALGEHTVRCSIVPMHTARRTLNGLASLAAGGSITEGAFHSPTLQSTINDWAADQRFDAALAVCSSTAAYIEHLPIARKVLDLVDVDSVKWCDYADGSTAPARWLYALESRRLQRAEQRLAGVFQTVALTTEREAELFRQVAPAAATLVAPNGVALHPIKPLPHGRPVAVFSGVLDYRPNVEGVEWFAREVWPLVKAQAPAAELRIVGRNPVDAVVRLSAIDGVRVVGEVDNVQPELDNAHVAIAPLAIARGIQNKALEAMAAARPVVVSPAVAGGITGAENGSELIVADSVAQWARAVWGMLTGPTTASIIGRAGRRFVERHHRWDDCLQPLVTALLPAKSVQLLPINDRIAQAA